MFVNCPFCRALVATDPATDLPPERCPRCAAPLRAVAADGAQAAADDARSGVAAAIAEVFGEQGAAQEDPAAGPAVSMATLLQPGSEPAPVAEAGPEPEPASETETEAESSAPTLLEPLSEREPESGSLPDASPDTSSDTASPATPVRPRRSAARTAPSFARRRGAITDADAARRRWPVPAAIVGLALLLALQWLLADRARLAADPTWRPLVAGTCAVLGCSLPAWREPSAFVLLERDVRPHPGAAGTLRITASFRNEAAWAQPWPEVVLVLSDVDGRPLGTRAFTATEYLGSAPPSALLASGQGAVIRMDVLEPAAGTVGFAFEFR